MSGTMKAMTLIMAALCLEAALDNAAFAQRSRPQPPTDEVRLMNDLGRRCFRSRVNELATDRRPRPEPVFVPFNCNPRNLQGSGPEPQSPIDIRLGDRPLRYLYLTQDQARCLSASLGSAETGTASIRLSSCRIIPPGSRQPPRRGGR